MSYSADRFRHQGLQLIVGGAIALVAALLILIGNGRIAWPGSWPAVLMQWLAVIIALLAAYSVIGGSILLLTADRPLFGGRR